MTELQDDAKWITEQAKTLPKPLPCIFCKNPKVGVNGHLEMRDAFWIWCDHCLCQGPFGSNPKEAVEKWNSRG